MIEAYDVKQIFTDFEERDEDEYYNFMEDLNSNARKNYMLEFPKGVLPEGWEVFVIEEKTSISRDSYGYSSSDEDYFIVIKVSDASGYGATFKLTGSHSSYEGWIWNVAGIKKVNAVPQVVYSWEEV